MNRDILLEQYRKDLPKITRRQVDIIEFWKVRGYEELSHCLGMNIHLNRKDPRYYGIGLCLQYLEQFLDEFKSKNAGTNAELSSRQPTLPLGFMGKDKASLVGTCKHRKKKLVAFCLYCGAAMKSVKGKWRIS